MISQLPSSVVLLPVVLLSWPAATYWTAFDQVFVAYPPEPLIAVLDASEPDWMRSDVEGFIKQLGDPK